MAQKDTRIQNNLISSLVYQVVLISLGFLLPRLYLENFGSEVNGVLSTVKQIFVYLFLLEAGVGLASTQALYGRIGKEDYQSVSEVLAATAALACAHRANLRLDRGAVLLCKLHNVTGIGNIILSRECRTVIHHRGETQL